ncbi:IPExxxVDY family protein [Flavobacterium sp. '19STA2R22 D10 B1']|uniref:IPExxxVDY family protein n=1 Tax=Flavobacterium aerium TaxID=3037261 RepID=UPI00278C4E75|nr:IPExxxVDY family protein [Flavobacterium sp. '19STA2R22 D10 B1']
MAIHKLHIDDFEEADYELIAIHTLLEDYRLAYLINQKLPIVLSRCNNDIHISITEGDSHFSRFIFDDQKKDISWNLFQNKNTVILNQKAASQNLFEESAFEFSKKVYLLPEFKKVDYFLKIENTDNNFDTNKIVTIINSIDRISTVYTVDADQIKSKNNLIF